MTHPQYRASEHHIPSASVMHSHISIQLADNAWNTRCFNGRYYRTAFTEARNKAQQRKTSIKLRCR